MKTERPCSVAKTIMNVCRELLDHGPVCPSQPGDDSGRPAEPAGSALAKRLSMNFSGVGSQRRLSEWLARNRCHDAARVETPLFLTPEHSITFSKR